MSAYKLSSRSSSAFPAEISHFISQHPPIGKIEVHQLGDGTHYHWPTANGDACALCSGGEFKFNLTEASGLPDKKILMELVSVAMRSGDPVLISDFANIIKEVWDA